MERGIRTSVLSKIIVIVMILLTAVLLIMSFATMRTYRLLLDTIDNQQVLTQSAEDLRSGSDYLTQQVRLYVMTGDVQYAENYLYESEVNRSRDRALEVIGHDEEEVDDLLNAALDSSNVLMERELYAIRLVAEAEGTDPSSLSQTVNEIALTAEDAALSAQEKREAAQGLVFDEVYQDYKNEIYENLDAASALIISRAEAAQQGISLRYRVILSGQMIFTVITLVVILSFLGVISIAVVNASRALYFLSLSSLVAP